jgi:hypothetical protein
VNTSITASGQTKIPQFCGGQFHCGSIQTDARPRVPAHDALELGCGIFLGIDLDGALRTAERNVNNSTLVR